MAAAAAAAAAAAPAGACPVFDDKGLLPLQHGHLRCLLQAGRLQTMLRLVDGLLTRCDGSGPGATAAACQLSALGVAAAWRLGSWQLLRSYLAALDAAATGGSGSGGSGVGVGLGIGAVGLDGLGRRGAAAHPLQLLAAGGGPAFAAGPGNAGAAAAAEAAAAAAAAALSAGDQWEVAVGALLEALQRGAAREVRLGLAAARGALLAVLPAVAAESYARAYPLVVKLSMLSEVEEALEVRRRDPPPSAAERRGLLHWRERLAATQPNLGTREPLLALRRRLAALLGDGAEEGRCWLQQAQLCRAAGQHDGAEAAALQALAAGVPGALLERCRLLWACDKGHRAIRELEGPVRRLQLEITAADGEAVKGHGGFGQGEGKAGVWGGSGEGAVVATAALWQDLIENPALFSAHTPIHSTTGDDDAGGDARMAEAGGGGGGGGGMGAGPEDARGRAQLVLQLAQWTQALGQGGRDELTRERAERSGGGRVLACMLGGFSECGLVDQHSRKTFGPNSARRHSPTPTTTRQHTPHSKTIQ